MNLVLLVEGAETEPRVYEAWIRHRLPALQRVPTVADLTTDGYVLVSGMGYPSYARRLTGLLQDIDERPGKVHDFWICVDSDDDSYEARLAEVSRVVAEARASTRLAKTNPSASASSSSTAASRPGSSGTTASCGPGRSRGSWSTSSASST